MSINTICTNKHPDPIQSYISIVKKIEQLNFEMNELKHEAATHKAALIKYYAEAGLYEYLKLNDAAVRKVKG